MPTAGEARLLKIRRENKREQQRGKANSKLKNAVSPKNKSKIPQPVKNTRANYGKENKAPITTKPTTATNQSKRPKTLTKTTKAKPAPDFSRLHSKWNSQFQKGKAVSKKPNTKVDAFVLGEQDKQTYGDGDCDGEIEFEVDENALQGILNNTGIQVEEIPVAQPKSRATIAAPEKCFQGSFPASFVKRTSIYYTGERKTHTQQPKPLTLANSGHVTRPAALQPRHDVQSTQTLKAKQVTFAGQGDSDDEEISFKPDNQALQSILSGFGVEGYQAPARHTLASTRFGSSLRAATRHSFLDSQPAKRTSIYYTGSKNPSKPARLSSVPTAIEKPSIPSQNALTVKTTLDVPNPSQYLPGSTVVGIQGDLPVSGNPQDPPPSLHVANDDKAKTAHEDKPIVTQPIVTQPSVKTLDPFMTPRRRLVKTQSTTPEVQVQSILKSSKPKVCWEDILTPHRSVARTTGLSSAGSQINIRSASRNVPSCIAEQLPSTPGLAQKLFFDDETKEHDISTNQMEMQELERQALEDLRQLELEEQAGCSVQQETPYLTIASSQQLNNPVQAPSLLTRSPALFIQCFPSNLTSVGVTYPPESTLPIAFEYTPSRCLVTTPRGLALSAHKPHMTTAPTPQYGMRTMTQPNVVPLVVPENRRVNSAGVSLPTTFLTPTPLRTPVRGPNVHAKPDAAIPFGLLSSVKKDTGREPPYYRPGRTPMLGRHPVRPPVPAWSDVLISSTPADTADHPVVEREKVQAYAERNGTVAAENQKLAMINGANILLDGNCTGQEASLDTAQPFTGKSSGKSALFEYNNTVNSKSPVARDFNVRNGKSSAFRSTISAQRPTKFNPTLGDLPRGSPSNSSGDLSITSATRPLVNSMPLASSVDLTTSLTESALLDAEVTLYTSLGERLRRTETRKRELVNPLVKTFNGCHAQCFAPVCHCSGETPCKTHPLRDLL